MLKLAAHRRKVGILTSRWSNNVWPFFFYCNVELLSPRTMRWWRKIHFNVNVLVLAYILIFSDSMLTLAWYLVTSTFRLHIYYTGDIVVVNLEIHKLMQLVNNMFLGLRSNIIAVGKLDSWTQCLIHCLHFCSNIFSLSPNFISLSAATFTLLQHVEKFKSWGCCQL